MQVLVVDDEQLLRDMLANVIEDLGGTVIKASSKTQALEILATHTFQLVITDYRMGDGTGHDVAAAAKQCRPAPHVVLMSGRPMKNYAPADEFLGKPFSVPDIQRIMDRCKP